ncbi:MAG TPA: hypothetical protein VFA48_02435 [Gammaproteobacteria bacterium]|nr:hypothetical protein [Gammaproteobacteria bacterium]
MAIVFEPYLLSRSLDQAYERYKKAMQGPLWDGEMERDIPVTTKITKRVLAYYTDALVKDNRWNVAHSVLETGMMLQVVTDRKNLEGRVCLYLRGLVWGYSVLHSVVAVETDAHAWQSDQGEPLWDMAVRWGDDDVNQLQIFEVKSTPGKQGKKRFAEYCVGDEEWILDLIDDD